MSFSHWLPRPLAAGALSALLAGCPSAEKPVAQDSGVAAAAAAADEEIVLPKIEGPVARVNGKDVPPDKFLHEYEQALRRYKNAKRPVTPAFDSTLRANILRRLIEAQVVMQKAEELGVKLDDAELEKEWSTFKARYGTPEAFKGFLERAVATEADLREQHRYTTIRGRLFTAVSSDVTVEPAEVQAEFEANKIRFKTPERVKVSHIFLRAPKSLPPDMMKERKKLADEVSKRAKKPGADFAQLATEVSEDDAKARGGDLGFVTRGAMPKPFEEVAFKLGAGQIGIAETDLGIHIIKVTSHEPEKQQSFNDVKEQIETTLKLRRQNQKKTETQRQWMDAAKIEWILMPEPKEPQMPMPPGIGAPQPAAAAQIQRAMQASDKKPLEKMAVPALKATPAGPIPPNAAPAPQH
ncbi:MAG: peptidylprolyl isomerase [Deltaproteobacteria bacterium]|nr:peptidylprolyl isomerase [Deltaproteobacteria bacterium]